MFPLKDENPTELTPIVTVALIVVNVLVWVAIQHAGSGEQFVESLCLYGAIPGEITGNIPSGTRIPLGQASCSVGDGGSVTLITSMFLHGGWMHLIGNMWFLWVFGNNIEDSMGHLRFIVFYLLTGVVATGAHVLTSMSSPVPMVGASGAVSGVMGAYIVLYPRVRVTTLIFIVFIVRVIVVPASVVLALWFGLQLLEGLAAAGTRVGGGVAFFAHVGGFVAGVALIKLFERKKLVQAKREGRRLDRKELRPRDRW